MGPPSPLRNRSRAAGGERLDRLGVLVYNSKGILIYGYDDDDSPITESAVPAQASIRSERKCLLNMLIFMKM